MICIMTTVFCGDENRTCHLESAVLELPDFDELFDSFLLETDRCLNGGCVNFNATSNAGSLFGLRDSRGISTLSSVKDMILSFLLNFLS